MSHSSSPLMFLLSLYHEQSLLEFSSLSIGRIVTQSFRIGYDHNQYINTFISRISQPKMMMLLSFIFLFISSHFLLRLLYCLFADKELALFYYRRKWNLDEWGGFFKVLASFLISILLDTIIGFFTDSQNLSVRCID